MTTTAHPCYQNSKTTDVLLRLEPLAVRLCREDTEFVYCRLQPGTSGVDWAAVSREAGARRAVCRASRLSCSRCTCTDAVPPCRSWGRLTYLLTRVLLVEGR